MCYKVLCKHMSRMKDEQIQVLTVHTWVAVEATLNSLYKSILGVVSLVSSSNSSSSCSTGDCAFAFLGILYGEKTTNENSLQLQNKFTKQQTRLIYCKNPYTLSVFACANLAALFASQSPTAFLIASSASTVYVSKVWVW